MGEVVRSGLRSQPFERDIELAFSEAWDRKADMQAMTPLIERQFARFELLNPGGILQFGERLRIGARFTSAA